MTSFTELKVLSPTIFLESGDSSNIDSLLHQIFRLSRQIFVDEHQMPSIDLKTGRINPATDFDHWKDRLLNQNGLIFYNIHRETQEILAFLFLYHRPYPSDSPLIALIQNKLSKEIDQVEISSKLKHIWIAGCDAKYRRHHLMESLFDFMETYCQDHTTEIKYLTINTYPIHFPSMPKFLVHMNYDLIQSIQEFEEESKTQVEKQTYFKELIVTNKIL